MTESKVPTYKILFTKTAQKDYENIKDSKLLRGINRILDSLKENPCQFKRLSGPFSGLRSVKTFSFRLLYEIEGTRHIVTVVSVENRKDVYR